MVQVEARKPGDYVGQVRGDVLSTGALSQAGLETLRVSGLEPEQCLRALQACASQLEAVSGVSAERRMATLAEMWTGQALTHMPERGQAPDQVALDAWLRAARYAYAYLFFTERMPGERAFENRQTQVRDYYNYAAEQVGAGLFQRGELEGAPDGTAGAVQIGQWSVRTDMQDFRLPGGIARPDALVPAGMLRFSGLLSIYRRDGFAPNWWHGCRPDRSATRARPARARCAHAASKRPHTMKSRTRRPPSCWISRARTWARCWPPGKWSCTPTIPIVWNRCP